VNRFLGAVICRLGDMTRSSSLHVSVLFSLLCFLIIRVFILAFVNAIVPFLSVFDTYIIFLKLGSQCREAIYLFGQVSVALNIWNLVSMEKAFCSIGQRWYRKLL
jgi:hypothetical protein